MLVLDRRVVSTIIYEVPEPGYIRGALRVRLYQAPAQVTVPEHERITFGQTVIQPDIYLVLIVGTDRLGQVIDDSGAIGRRKQVKYPLSDWTDARTRNAVIRKRALGERVDYRPCNGSEISRSLFGARYRSETAVATALAESLEIGEEKRAVLF